MIFRSPSLGVAGDILGAMFGANGLDSATRSTRSLPVRAAHGRAARLRERRPEHLADQLRPRLCQGMATGIAAALAIMTISSPTPSSTSSSEPTGRVSSRRALKNMCAGRPTKRADPRKAVNLLPTPPLFRYLRGCADRRPVRLPSPLFLVTEAVPFDQQGCCACARQGFSRLKHVLDLPNLIDIQKASFEWFLEEGLRETIDDISPIEDYTGTLAVEFGEYEFGQPPVLDQGVP